MVKVDSAQTDWHCLIIIPVLLPVYSPPLSLPAFGCADVPIIDGTRPSADSATCQLVGLGCPDPYVLLISSRERKTTC